MSRITMLGSHRRHGIMHLPAQAQGAYINTTANMTATTLNMYTVPSGMRALWTSLSAYCDGTPTTDAFDAAISVAGTSYRFNQTKTLAANAFVNSFNATQPAGFNYVAEAGEILQVTRTTAGAGIGATFRGAWVTFDAASGVLKTVKKTGSWASGDNTIYTVPAGYTAMLLATGSPISHEAFIGYSNSSGASRNVVHFVVPSGQASATKYRVRTTTTITDGSTSTQRLFGLVMNAGDRIIINTTSVADTQFAWATVLETPV